ncbi:MAG: hypothetical protein FWF12_12605, partial [Betaproteobacteria bacterium]|nr:hypothetical protein [Betaproteobacteria bacterium]
ARLPRLWLTACQTGLSRCRGWRPRHPALTRRWRITIPEHRGGASGTPPPTTPSLLRGVASLHDCRDCG